MNILDWLQNWYKDRCDGDWEHGYGVKIDTLDNPGWDLVIDLKETKLKNMHVDYKCIKNGDDDWYGYKIVDNKFSGVGDPTKLKVLLNIFRKIWEEN